MGIDLTGEEETNWMARGRDNSRGASLPETEDSAEPDSEDADTDIEIDPDADDDSDESE